MPGFPVYHLAHEQFADTQITISTRNPKPKSHPGLKSLDPEARIQNGAVGSGFVFCDPKPYSLNT